MSGPLLGLPAAVDDLNKLCTNIYRAISRRTVFKWSTDAHFNNFTKDNGETSFLQDNLFTDASVFSNGNYFFGGSMSSSYSVQNYTCESSLFSLTGINTVYVLGKGMAYGGTNTLSLVSENETVRYTKSFTGGGQMAWGPFEEVNWDVSTYTGNHKFRLNIYTPGSTGYQAGIAIYQVFLDNMPQKVGKIFIRDNKLTMAPHMSRLIMLSPVLAPTDLCEWDMTLYSVLANQGSCVLDVLNGSDGSLLVSNVANGDMLNLPGVASVRYRIIFEKTNITNTASQIDNIGFAYLV